MRILIKIGSALISKNNRINYGWLKRKVAEISSLHSQDTQVILVSSGAVAAGMEIENLTVRPADVLKLQLLAGIGQIRLMKYYKDYFKKRQIHVAQILLTHHNFASPNEEATITQIMNAYLEQGTIPIVNENDMVNKEEVDIRPVFTDNDILAALVAVRLRVDRLLILTDVDGLYLMDPKQAETELIPEVPEITAMIKTMASRETNPLGLGGMFSKVQAAEITTRQGIETIVANGAYRLDRILDRQVPQTRFIPSGRWGAT